MTSTFVVDFGSQYTYLLANTIRNANIYCEIISPFDLLNDELEVIDWGSGNTTV